MAITCQQSTLPLFWSLCVKICIKTMIMGEWKSNSPLTFKDLDSRSLSSLWSLISPLCQALLLGKQVYSIPSWGRVLCVLSEGPPECSTYYTVWKFCQSWLISSVTSPMTSPSHELFFDECIVFTFCSRFVQRFNQWAYIDTSWAFKNHSLC